MGTTWRRSSPASARASNRMPRWSSATAPPSPPTWRTRPTVRSGASRWKKRWPGPASRWWLAACPASSLGLETLDPVKLAFAVPHVRRPIENHTRALERDEPAPEPPAERDGDDHLSSERGHKKRLLPSEFGRSHQPGNRGRFKANSIAGGKAISLPPPGTAPRTP